MAEILVEILQELQLYGELALNKCGSVAKCDKVVFLGFDLCLVEIPVFVLSTQEKVRPHSATFNTYDLCLHV